jgi:hypothetical protein
MEANINIIMMEPPLPLPEGVQSRYVSLSTGLQMHLLEAGQVVPGGTSKPLILLLHGFPELAYSWRHQLTALAQAGFHVVAPDQRGYGRSTGSDDRYEGDWRASNMPNLVSDMLATLPHYYVMPYPSPMADAVAPFMPTVLQIQTCTWLTDSDLAVYVAEYARRGFQGGLQWYRCSTDRNEHIALSRFSGQRILPNL